MFFLQEGKDNGVFNKMATPSADPKAKQFMFFPEEKTGRWFQDAGIPERALINWVNDNFINSDKDFLDIGAHIGTYSFLLGKKARHTHAFECSPRTFCYLAANIALHGLEEKITPYRYALGNKSDTLDYIIRSEDGGGNGCKVLCDNDRELRRVPITMRTLDSFNFNNIGFIKIDVEGFEKEVLEGGVETLKRNGWPKIIFESWGSWKEREGVPAVALREELFSYLRDVLGYNIIAINGVNDMFLAEKKK